MGPIDMGPMLCPMWADLGFIWFGVDVWWIRGRSSIWGRSGPIYGRSGIDLGSVWFRSGVDPEANRGRGVGPGSGRRRSGVDLGAKRGRLGVDMGSICCPPPAPHPMFTPRCGAEQRLPPRHRRYRRARLQRRHRHRRCPRRGPCSLSAGCLRRGPCAEPPASNRRGAHAQQARPAARGLGQLPPAGGPLRAGAPP